MALPFNYFPFLENVIKDPASIVFWAAFGFPLLMFLFGFPLLMFLFGLLTTKVFKNTRFVDSLGVILFSSVFFTWLAGFVIMMVFLFSGVSGIKMYFTWLLLFISSLIFSAMNVNLIIKSTEDLSMQRLKKKS